MRVRPGASFWVTLACIAIALGMAQPAIFHCVPGAGFSSCQWSFNHHGSTSDWRYFAEAWETARVSLSDFHQLPSWNPYHCGGLVLYQDPQAPFPGPLFLLTFWWLSTGAAVKVWIIAHLMAGTLGARALIRDRGGNCPEQVLAAVLVAGCGFVAWHTGGGHLSFTPFLFFPAILWAFRRSLVDARWAVMVAALFALSFYEGATYPIPLMLVGLAIESAARLGSAFDRRGLLVSLSLLGVLFPLLAGARLVPVLHYLREHPRLVPLDDQMTLGEVLRTWTLPMHERAFTPHPYVWDEFADYVGVVPVALLLAGIAVALIRRDADSRLRRIDLALLAALIWCALGNIPGASLFGVLHELPIYKSLRVPSRFLGPSMVPFALLVTSALMVARQTLDDGAQSRHGPLVQRLRLPGLFLGLELALVLAIVLDICTTNAPRIQQGLDPVLPRTPAASADFYQATGTDYGRFPTHPVRGVGTRQCYVPLEWKPAPGIVDGKVAQQWVEPATAGAATPRAWSPNAVELEVKLRAPGVVVINQNYESGWRASAGEIGAYLLPQHHQWLRSSRSTAPVETPPVGLLSVALSAGTHRLILRHRPPGLAPGIALTLIGLGLAVFAIRALAPARRARWRAALAARFSPPAAP
jgi:hypothetical protein